MANIEQDLARFRKTGHVAGAAQMVLRRTATNNILFGAQVIATLYLGASTMGSAGEGCITNAEQMSDEEICQ